MLDIILGASLVIFGASILASFVSAICRLSTKRFRGMKYREIVRFNPPGALLSQYGRILPYAGRLAIISGVVLIPALLLRLVI